MTDAQMHWERCRGWIEAAVLQGPGLETIEDVERQIEAGHYSFWPGIACAAVCEIREYEDSKCLVVLHGGGDLAELLENLEPLLCEYARAQGCETILGEGRKGWERAAVKNGYRFGFITMIKNLEN